MAMDDCARALVVGKVGEGQRQMMNKHGFRLDRHAWIAFTKEEEVIDR